MATHDREISRLIALNDTLLRPLIEAPDEAAAGAALEALLAGEVEPTIRAVLSRFIQSEGAIQLQDAEDLGSTVIVRLMQRLKACAVSEDGAIEHLRDYVAMQTYNAVHDLLRVRFPRQMRLRSRLRYILTHDSRLALWLAESGPAAGLARFRGASPAGGEIAISRESATAAMLDESRSAEALLALCTHLGRAVRFEALVRAVAQLWRVTDAPPVSIDSVSLIDQQRGPHERIETRQYLAALWSEIRELRAAQRAALLLNLREADERNGLALFLVAGVATLDEIAGVLDLSVTQLAELWPRLPLDDRAIGEMLGLERQQIINLRQAARTRLARRMSRNRKG